MQAERWQEGLQQTALWLVLSMLVFGLGRVGWLNWARSGGEWMVGGFSKAGAGIVRVFKAPGRAVAFSFVGMERISDLERRLADLAVERARIQELTEENNSLRTLLSVEKNENVTGGGVVAEVVVGANNEWLVDVGQREGVVEGMVVLDEKGVLVGKIVAVGRFSSRIERPSSLGASIGAKVLGKETQGVLEGEGGTAVLTGVLQEESLAIDDVLVASGTDGEYPEGVVLGQVVELTGQPSDVTKGAVVELLATGRGSVLVR